MNNIKNPALIVIDVQKGFDTESYFGKRNNPNMERNIKKLLDYWRKQKAPVIFVKHNSTEIHSPLRKGSPGNEFSIKNNEEEVIFEKTVNSSFYAKGPKGICLEHYLQNLKVKNIVLVGLTTDHCVSTTARMGANLGFEVMVVADGCATFGKAGFTSYLIHDTALASLSGEFATIVNTSELLP